MTSLLCRVATPHRTEFLFLTYLYTQVSSILPTLDCFFRLLYYTAAVAANGPGRQIFLGSYNTYTRRFSSPRYSFLVHDIAVLSARHLDGAQASVAGLK